VDVMLGDLGMIQMMDGTAPLVENHNANGMCQELVVS